MEVGIDLDDDWPEAAGELIGAIVQAEISFLADVKQFLHGVDCEPLLECGFWVGYDDPVWQIPSAECDARLKDAGRSGASFLESIDNALKELDSRLGVNSFPNGTYCSVAANGHFRLNK